MKTLALLFRDNVCRCLGIMLAERRHHCSSVAVSSPIVNNRLIATMTISPGPASALPGCRRCCVRQRSADRPARLEPPASLPIAGRWSNVLLIPT